jgi:hypothetical protein
VKFAQGTVDVAVNQEEIRCFPRDPGTGWLGLQRAIESVTLAGEVSGDLICGGQIEPVTGVVRVKIDSGPKTFDRGLRIARNKRIVAADP